MAKGKTEEPVIATDQKAEEKREEATKWVGKNQILVHSLETLKKSEFLVFDIKEGKLFMELPKLESGCGADVSIVDVDQILYAIGCDNNDMPTMDGLGYKHTGSSFLDLKDPHANGWRKFGQLHLWRSRPECVVLGKKMYAFGGETIQPPRIQGEVCDALPTKFFVKKTERGLWKSLPSTPLHPASGFVIKDSKHNRVFLYSFKQHSLYAYYPTDENDNEGKWVVHDNDMRLWSMDHLVANTVVDGVIYSFYRHLDVNQSFAAYDISAKKTIKVTWTRYFDPSHQFSCCPFRQLLNLDDGVLCLPYVNYASDPDLSTFYFFRMSVCRVSPDEVQVTPLSVKSIQLQEHRSHPYFLVPQVAVW